MPWTAPCPPGPSRGPVVDLVTTHEAAVADVLLGDRRADDLRTISWSAHPTMVTVPLWRAVVGEALDVSRQLTGSRHARRPWRVCSAWSSPAT